jgi:hypothetical protein
MQKLKPARSKMSIKTNNTVGEAGRKIGRGLLFAFKHPLFWAVFFPVAIVFLFVINLTNAWGMYFGLLSSALPFGDKLDILGSLVRHSFTDLSTSIDSRIFLLMSILQGLCIAMLVISVKTNREFDVPDLSKMSISSIIMLVGLGCPSCGTSILIPFLSLFVSSAAAAASWLSTVFMLIAICLSLWAILKMAHSVSQYAL